MGRGPGTQCDKCGSKLIRRQDDEPEAIRNRLKVYRAQTAPVIDWYEEKGMKVHRVDADGSVDEVTRRAVEALEK
jgi:adenylate kinase